MIFCDVSHAITTHTSHSEYCLGTGSSLNNVCCAYPVLVRLSPKGAACRVDFMSQEERYVTKPAFLLFYVTAVLGWIQLTCRYGTELSLTNVGVSSPVLSK